MCNRAAVYHALIATLLVACFGQACSDTGEFDDADTGVTPADATSAMDADDARGDEDIGACAESCTDDRPICDETSGECVACTSDVHCTDGVCDPDANACVTCYDDTHCTEGLCDLAAGECVECTADAHCHDPLASACGLDNTCTACTDSSQCGHVEGRNVCDTAPADSVCVTCTVEDESACGAFACDPATNDCTQTERGTVATCGKCKADSECIADHRCVPMQFDGEWLEDSYCLPVRPASGCADIPYLQALERESLSGALAERYCGINEELTTCDAVEALGADCSTDADCGAGSYPDGICDSYNRCTYRCASDAECENACSDAGLCLPAR